MKRKILCLSLFNGWLPNGSTKAFLDNADSLWYAFDRYGSEHGLETLQVFTIGRGLRENKAVTVMKDNTPFRFAPKRPVRVFFELLKELRQSSVVLLNNENYLSFGVGFAAKLLGVRVIIF